MDQHSANNRRIAKNALFLYLRMGVTMVISLYTSRIVLNALGATDYGIYNVVGVIVVLFCSLNSSVTNGIQRYFSYYLGQNDEKTLKNAFSNSLIIIGGMMILILIICETFGLWWLDNKVVLPPGSASIARRVYQLSIATTLVTMIRLPFNAAIISYERMNFYAVVNIGESILKLGLVLCLLLISSSRLIIYAWMIFGLSLLITPTYIIYALRLLPEGKITFHIETPLLKRMLSFSGWNVFTSIGDISYQQGLALVINHFFGVLINATMGITSQIKTAVFSFCSNLQVAFNPQITKSFALGEMEYCRDLVVRASKFSFFLMALIALPVILNINYILKIWLIAPPPETNIFVTLTLLFCLLDSVVGPLWIIAQASGKIKWYNIITGLALLLNIPAAIFVLNAHAPAWSIVLTQILIGFILLLYRIYYAVYLKVFTFGYYLRKVTVPILICISGCLILFFLLRLLITIPPFPYLIITGITSIAGILTIIYLFALDSSERLAIRKFILKKRSL